MRTFRQSGGQGIRVHGGDLLCHDVGYPILAVDHTLYHDHLVTLEDLAEVSVDPGAEDDVGETRLILQRKEDMALRGGGGLLGDDEAANADHQVARKVRKASAGDGAALVQMGTEEFVGVAGGGYALDRILGGGFLVGSDWWECGSWRRRKGEGRRAKGRVAGSAGVPPVPVSPRPPISPSPVLTSPVPHPLTPGPYFPEYLAAGTAEEVHRADGDQILHGLLGETRPLEKVHEGGVRTASMFLLEPLESGLTQTVDVGEAEPNGGGGE